MLESLKVRNLALIENCEIEFTKGLNVLTGETGAGKSILLGSVMLALGQRAEGDVIRNGADEAFVELVFSMDSRCKEILDELDIPSDDDVVIINRKITPSKSTYRINGVTVISRQVKEIASALIDIHGQHEHQSLLDAGRQLKMLDAYGGNAIEEALDKVKTTADAYKDAMNRLKDAESMAEGRERAISLLEYEVGEIDEADLKPGEDEELETSYKRLSSAEKISENLSEAMNLISSGSMEDAGEMLSRAIAAMERVTGLDESAEELLCKLTEAEGLLGDFSLAASKYSDSLEYDEDLFVTVEERLNKINYLKSKFGRTIEDVLKYRDDKAAELDNLRNLDEYREKLKEECKKAGSEYEKAAGTLSKLRSETALKFTDALTKTLEGLNFLNVNFSVGIESDATRVSANGFDDIEFMISTNVGEPVKPVRNVASGGELSRIMLGIKTILADKDEIDSLIFDEIDTGISGVTAREVGKRLYELSSKHQVILITHLAQIAAFANTHFVIDKKAEAGKTKTDITMIEGEARVSEIARLLGGDSTSVAAITNARELIESLGNG